MSKNPNDRIPEDFTYEYPGFFKALYWFTSPVVSWAKDDFGEYWTRSYTISKDGFAYRRMSEDQLIDLLFTRGKYRRMHDELVAEERERMSKVNNG